MDIQGKIIAILLQRSGTSKTGNAWKSQDFVIETHDQYARKMCFNVWGDRIDQFNIQEGEALTVSFDIDAREWEGKWFNTIRAWKIERGQQPVKTAEDMYKATAPEYHPDPNMPAHEPFGEQNENRDDLPF